MTIDQHPAQTTPADPEAVDPAEADPADPGPGGMGPGIVFLPPRGPKVHTGRPGRRGWLKVRREGAPTTTRQAEVLNTAIIGSPGDERGVVIGTDRLSAAMFAHDQFTAYAAGTITSPNVCVLGMVGAGKSALLAPPLGDREAQPGLDRCRLAVEIVAVERQSRLEPQ